MEFDLSRIHGVSIEAIEKYTENTNNVIFMTNGEWPSLGYVSPLMWDTSVDKTGALSVRP